MEAVDEGLGRYVDDLPHGACLHIAFVRSPHAHARIVAVDRAAALGMPGVEAVVVGDELGQAAPIPVNRFTPDLKLPDYRAARARTAYTSREVRCPARRRCRRWPSAPRRRSASPHSLQAAPAPPADRRCR